MQILCNLLSENDLASIQTALDAALEITMERTLDKLHIRVTTSRAPPVWHPFHTLARLEVWHGHIYTTQYFTSAEELRRNL